VRIPTGSLAEYDSDWGNAFRGANSNVRLTFEEY
jgi:hypothetical protein